LKGNKGKDDESSIEITDKMQKYREMRAFEKLVS
jgi:hypothetical protein